MVLTAIMLASTARHGHILFRDFVTVPDPVINEAALGMDGYLPRAVPLDLVTALIAGLVPPAVQQRVLLLVALLGAGMGFALLVRSWPWAPPVAAAAAIWNPFVVERLLLGQAPTMLAYTTIPWLVLAFRAKGGLGRRTLVLTCAALPAALTPWGSVATLITVTALIAHSRRLATGLPLLAGPALLTMPWLLPALSNGVGSADADGAVAFAPQADAPGGVLTSIMTLGGIWAQGAHLASRLSGGPLIASVALILLAGYGAVRASAGRGEVRLALAGWSVPTVVVLVLATTWGQGVAAQLQAVPGVALIRDSHRLLGWSAGAVAVLTALGASAAVTGLRSRLRVRAAGPAMAVVAVSLCALTAPDAGARLREAYRPTDIPREWSQAVAAVPSDGRVLVLPWQALRAPTWADGRPFVDPLPLAVDARTVRSTTLTVERGGSLITVDDGEPAAASRWRSGLLEPHDLDAHDVEAVFIWKDSPGEWPRQVRGFELVHDGPAFAVWTRDDAGRSGAGDAPPSGEARAQVTGRLLSTLE
ncbi:hypothetical protein GCM10022199_20060 [Marihabitans asiaticum]|uniref:Uncharacterized protein n=1 Tax=Marihabitans asiaticum TaxID=415218 RepID=A0A560WAS7_9MICO|nr:hypothetical protein FB557_2162 [Marihabitans asiaticum]